MGPTGGLPQRGRRVLLSQHIAGPGAQVRSSGWKQTPYPAGHGLQQAAEGQGEEKEVGSCGGLNPPGRPEPPTGLGARSGAPRQPKRSRRGKTLSRRARHRRAGGSLRRHFLGVVQPRGAAGCHRAAAHCWRVEGAGRRSASAHCAAPPAAPPAEGPSFSRRAPGFSKKRSHRLPCRQEQGRQTRFRARPALAWQAKTMQGVIRSSNGTLLHEPARLSCEIRRRGLERTYRS